MINRFLVVCLLFLGFYYPVESQNFAGLQDTVLNLPEDYGHQETNALKCANYVLNVPIDKFNLNRLYAMKFF